MNPGVTGTSAGALEMEQLAISEIRGAGDRRWVCRTLNVDSVLDAEHDPWGLIEHSTVAAASGLRCFDIGLPQLSLFAPELFVRSVRIDRAVPELLDGPVTVFSVLVNVFSGSRAGKGFAGHSLFAHFLLL